MKKLIIVAALLSAAPAHAKAVSGAYCMALGSGDTVEAANAALDANEPALFENFAKLGIDKNALKVERGVAAEAPQAAVEAAQAAASAAAVATDAAEIEATQKTAAEKSAAAQTTAWRKYHFKTKDASIIDRMVELDPNLDCGLESESGS